MSDRGSWLTAWRPGGGLAVKLEMPTKKTGRGRRPRRQRQQERERARGLLPTSSSKLRSLSLPDVPWPATGPVTACSRATRWQYDLWYQIIRAELEGHPDQVDLTYHEAPIEPRIDRQTLGQC